MGKDILLPYGYVICSDDVNCFFPISICFLLIPLLFQNKDFIYIGTELERLGEFMQRIQEHFPGSELLRTTDVSQDVMNGPGKHILEI